MSEETKEGRGAVAGLVQQPVRPGSESRWYCLSRDGMATLCTDEEDAKEVAAESFVLYPQNGPYRVAQMVDASAVAAERERCAKKVRSLKPRQAWCPDSDAAAHAELLEEAARAIEGPN